MYLSNYLVIVESPAKAKTISKYLGSRYAVKASFGHVRDLPKSQLGVDIEKDFAPKYITIRGKGDIAKELRESVKKSSKVFLATDPDREGEAISWHLAHVLGLDLDSPLRVTFNEVTPQAVKAALKKPRRIDEALVDSQQARRIIDRIVGYKLSPLLWVKVRKGLSAGRVQSVTVSLIVNREREIKAFVPREYWTVHASFDNGHGKQFVAKLMGAELTNEAEVTSLLPLLSAATFTVESLKQATKERKPLPPFITSTLQQEAAKRLGFTAKRTMRIAQALYEGLDVGSEGSVGLITYMRTDSSRLSPDAIAAAGDFIKQNYGDDFHHERQYTAKRGTQDAHEAIRPTFVERRPDNLKAQLSPEQYKLYRLIHERFVASQMANARYDTVQADIRSDEHCFRAIGSRLIFPGFTVLYSHDLEDGDDQAESALPTLALDQVLRISKVIPKQHFTQAPPRYTEATLIKALEEAGVGRPSTYAPTLDTIESRGYVAKEQKRFVATELGTIVHDIVTHHFPELVEVQFTAALEDKLDAIANGQTTGKGVLNEFWGPFSAQLEQAFVGVERIEVPEEVSDELCGLCGRNMVIKTGRFGRFLACPGFPTCRNTKPLLNFIGFDCPLCGGGIVERRGKRGRVFYGCANYPQCAFVVWSKPSEKRCPQCGTFTIEKKNRQGETQTTCGNPQCQSSKEATK